MANQVYPKAKEAFLSGSMNLLTDTLKVVLVDSANYGYSSTHQYLSDIPSAARIATSPALASKTVSNGVFDAGDTVFSAAVGAQSEFLVLYKDTGVSSTSPLIAFIDTATGLPVTPNGGDINVTFDTGSNKIFAL